ncbi:MAG: HAMP domain-containing sensor histidine kinase [Rhodococcus sp. (in: high G+C Gram-positive bacteria)]|uniref:sensor histidine kinase n=1 Tax=Rhodococcus sp. TaxID=1831 RepID=UPI002AD5FC6F|nr:HAMP domain-containing sensor histidine kinase [Rhodococcus sp. (in: high G+C Gram-positive bacteria)]
MRRRVLLVLMIYSTVVVLALSVPLALLVGRERAQRLGENRAAAASFFAELSSREDESGVARIRESLQRYNSLYDEGVAVVDRTGGVRAASGLEVQRADVQQAVAGALRNQRGDLPSSLTPWSDSSVLIAAPIGGGTQVDGAVVLEASTDSARRDVAIAWVVIAVGAMLILATVAVIAVALSRWVVRPLSTLSSRVHSFGDKFHDQVSVEGSHRLEPVPYVGPPEVRELSSAFEAMADDVEAATAAQRRLVADTAHALRNPLAALRIRMDVLGMRVPDSATDAHLRTTLEVDRLSSVVEGLLVLAAAETPASTRSPGCELGAVVADRVEFWSSTIIVAGMTVHVSEPDADAHCRVAMSEDDLTRILDALLSNATKYAGSGSGIEIVYRSSDTDVTMCLSDNGPGVPADELAKVVDRFYRASGAHGDGTGLGLSIVHALTERAGGSLQVMERRPVGLRIELRLPKVVS